MSIWQLVENGSLVDTSASATTASSTSVSNELDKEDFLKLLVAEMQYQDPLEPQSNTDYVAQLATFTQVEAMENMSQTMETLQANELIGKTVIMCTTSSTTGETSYVTGEVDYVMMEGSNIYLSIGGCLYNLDDLYTIADTEYMEATYLADDFETAVSALPDAENVTLAYEEVFASIREQYDALTDYQKTFIQNNCSGSYEKFIEAETALNALIALRDAVLASAEESEAEDDETTTEDDETTEETTETETE